MSIVIFVSNGSVRLLLTAVQVKFLSRSLRVNRGNLSELRVICSVFSSLLLSNSLPACHQITRGRGSPNKKWLQEHISRV